ncbi:MAG: ABC transporter ATP-binding protein, partial [Rhodospirillaceae bacterium]|nr:ABC transporter ATP-binding protein [Rhodospirillaceae bacterium]
MASVRLDRLTKRYGDVTAVDALGIDVGDGEFLTLLGPSGCGKSTALACIAGLERLSDGAISSTAATSPSWSPPSATSPWSSRITRSTPHMSVRDNMSFGLRQQRIDAGTIRQQVETAAEMLDLGPLL